MPITGIVKAPCLEWQRLYQLYEAAVALSGERSEDTRKALAAFNDHANTHQCYLEPTLET